MLLVQIFGFLELFVVFLQLFLDFSVGFVRTFGGTDAPSRGRADAGDGGLVVTAPVALDFGLFELVEGGLTLLLDALDFGRELPTLFYGLLISFVFESRRALDFFGVIRFKFPALYFFLYL